MPEQLWSHEETATFLQLAPSTLYEMNAKRTGPPSFKLGKHRRYDPSDVWRWVHEHADRNG